MCVYHGRLKRHSKALTTDKANRLDRPIDTGATKRTSAAHCGNHRSASLKKGYKRVLLQQRDATFNQRWPLSPRLTQAGMGYSGVIEQSRLNKNRQELPPAEQSTIRKPSINGASNEWKECREDSPAPTITSIEALGWAITSVKLQEITPTMEESPRCNYYYECTEDSPASMIQRSGVATATNHTVGIHRCTKHEHWPEQPLAVQHRCGVATVNKQNVLSTRRSLQWKNEWTCITGVDYWIPQHEEVQTEGHILCGGSPAIQKDILQHYHKCLWNPRQYKSKTGCYRHNHRSGFLNWTAAGRERISPLLQFDLAVDTAVRIVWTKVCASKPMWRTNW
jgi:hypothetical protein